MCLSIKCAKHIFFLNQLCHLQVFFIIWMIKSSFSLLQVHVRFVNIIAETSCIETDKLNNIFSKIWSRLNLPDIIIDIQSKTLKTWSSLQVPDNIIDLQTNLCPLRLCFDWLKCHKPTTLPLAISQSDVHILLQHR